MLLAWAVAPMVLVITLTVWLRRPTHHAAWLGVLTAVVIALTVSGFGLPLRPALGHAAEGLLLTADAAMVIVSGLFLNALLARRQVHQRLAEWVRNLPMRTHSKVAVVVAGFGPALESLTGFGVSLLLTVPVLLALTDRATALRQSALSLTIMPWGTLGLATMVAGALAREPIAAVGSASSLVSAMVFPVFGAIATSLVCGRVDGWGARLRAAAAGAGIGAMFAVSLVLCNHAGIVELSGVLSGLISGVAGLLLFSRRDGRTSLVPPRAAAAPYALALALAATIRVLLALGVPLDHLALHAGRVEFAPLTSPGIPLLLAGVAIAAGRVDRRDVLDALGRSRKTLTALLGFTSMAQVMAVSGMVAAIGRPLAAAGALGAVFLSPALGIISGFLTGSNIGGNALMIGVQSTAGAGLGSSLALTSVQNSAAGHAVFASLPETLLVLAVAGNSDAKEESALIRFNLKVLGVVYCLLAASTAVVLSARFGLL